MNNTIGTRRPLSDSKFAVNSELVLRQIFELHTMVDIGSGGLWDCSTTNWAEVIFITTIYVEKATVCT